MTWKVTWTMRQVQACRRLASGLPRKTVAQISCLQLTFQRSLARNVLCFSYKICYEMHCHDVTSTVQACLGLAASDCRAKLMSRIFLLAFCALVLSCLLQGGLLSARRTLSAACQQLLRIPCAVFCGYMEQLVVISCALVLLLCNCRVAFRTVAAAFKQLLRVSCGLLLLCIAAAGLLLRAYFSCILAGFRFPCHFAYQSA